jgi:hypothetical protein
MISREDQLIRVVQTGVVIKIIKETKTIRRNIRNLIEVPYNEWFIYSQPDEEYEE